jgi:CIC family chloride channel protein
MLIWNLGAPRDPSLAMAAATASLQGMRAEILHDEADGEDVAHYVVSEPSAGIVVSLPCEACRGFANDWTGSKSYSAWPRSRRSSLGSSRSAGSRSARRSGTWLNSSTPTEIDGSIVSGEETPQDTGSTSTLGGPLARLRMSEHTFMVVAALIVGVLAGLGAVGFRTLIHELQRLFWGADPVTLEVIRSHSLLWIILAPAIGGAIVGPLVWFFAREAKGHGVPEVMEAVALNSGTIRPRVVIVKSLASALSIASGGSVGREGPIVQIGSALGSTLGQWLKVSGRRLRTLVGCGAAAGIAATFNAPVAGALFAVEIILGDFAVTQFSPIVIASVVATVVSRHFLGDVPAFVVPIYNLDSPLELVFYLVLGIVAAFAALAFVRTLYGFEDLAARIPIKPWLLTPIGFALVGVIGLWFPQVFGVGYEAIESALRGEMALGILAVLFGVKVIATSITIGSGGSGGVFAPSLFLGAMVGGSVGVAANALFPEIAPYPGAYALVGMGAVVAGATHAPITAILIIFELTHDYGLIVDIFAGREVNVLRSLRVRGAMYEEAPVIRPQTHLGQIIDRVTTEAPDYLYVVDDDGVLRGVIGSAEMRGAFLEASSLRDLVVAADLARDDVPVVTPDQDLDVVMRIFGGKNREELPVVTDVSERRFLGTITRGHLLEAYNRELRKRDMVSEIVGGLASAQHDAVSLGEGHWMKELSAPGTFCGHALGELDVRERHGVQIVLVRRPASGRGGEQVDLVPGQIVAVGPAEALEKLESL